MPLVRYRSLSGCTPTKVVIRTPLKYLCSLVWSHPFSSLRPHASVGQWSLGHCDTSGQGVCITVHKMPGFVRSRSSEVPLIATHRASAYLKGRERKQRPPCANTACYILYKLPTLSIDLLYIYQWRALHGLPLSRLSGGAMEGKTSCTSIRHDVHAAPILSIAL